MNASENSKEVVSLVKRLKGEYAVVAGAQADSPAGGPCGPQIDSAEPVLCEFIRSFMLWEATTAKADAVLKRLHEAVVDFNELRICLPDELVRTMGERYPRVEERALRMRAALNEIYHRQHAVTLEPLLQMSKREAKEYLDSLEGVPRFVSSRVLLIRLAAHAAPVDGRIAKRLIEADIADAGSTPEAAAAALERKVKAGDLLEVYQLLQAWADDAPLNYSETPVELPKRRDSRIAPTGNNHHDSVKKRGASTPAGGPGSAATGARSGKGPTKKKSAS